MVNDRQMTWDELAEENSNLKAEKAVLQNALDSYGELKDMTALQITTKIKDLTEKNKGLCEALRKVLKWCKPMLVGKKDSELPEIEKIANEAIQQFGGGYE